MRCDRQDQLARLVNLALPGGGLIVLRRAWAGTSIALLFAVCFNFAIGAALIFPDEIPDWLAGLSIGATFGIYLGAQIRLFVTIRALRRNRSFEQRRRALCDIETLMRRGDFSQAQSRMCDVAHLADTDLLVAYRCAQVLTGADDPVEAGRAWHRLRALDRHRVYRREIEAHRHLWDEGPMTPSRAADPERKAT